VIVCKNQDIYLRLLTDPLESGNDYMMNKMNTNGEIQVEFLDAIVEHLTQIGIELSAEKDVDKLLEKILIECMNITGCDAGSLYFKEDCDGEDCIRFRHTQNKSKSFPFKSFTMPLNTNSIAGACAFNGVIYNLKSMDETVEKIGIKHDGSFDKSINYKTCNMLVIPMKNYSGDVIGVLQLINKKRDPDLILGEPESIPEQIVPFLDREAEIIESLAAQAAILIERSQLFDEIEELLESFTVSLVTALDQRDPITAGHSKRVTEYALNLAHKVDEVGYGPYADLHFSQEEFKEMYYAGLLHDVGKIGVREFVLMKQNKLLDSEMQALFYKYQWIKNHLIIKSKEGNLIDNEALILENIEGYWAFISDINQKGYLPDDELLKLEFMGGLDFELQKKNLEGETITETVVLLTPHELESLSIRKGTLTAEERAMIQSHARFSFEILSGIKWTSELSNVPIISASHHEKMNGEGYPKGLTADEMPVQARILAVADIFDALTAKDRPYKPAIPIPKTLDIIQEEADRYHLDPDLVEIFVKEKAYELEEKGEA